ncbi:MAG: MarR family transcriptional regulator [Rhizobiaceae bacterium]|nr:MarR family transcriptional regulator [Rhizobiaceae bacterium]
MDRTDIEQVRRFNRLVTRRAGALEDDYLKRGRPLGEARLLYEIGADGDDVSALRDRLALDSAYVSRLLRSLEAQGLLTVSADTIDRRRRSVKLTPLGQAERDAYDALSDDLAMSLLEPLGGRQRTRLLAAMADVETLLKASSIAISRDRPDSPDAVACLAAYFAELDARFDGGFDPGIGGAAADMAMAPPHGSFLVARLDGAPVASGGLKVIAPGIGEIKRMWVAAPVRGMGLARRLLKALEAEAARLGLATVRLDTNRSLTEAHALYRTSGYAEIARYNDNPYAHLFFEKALPRPD